METVVDRGVGSVVAEGVDRAYAEIVDTIEGRGVGMVAGMVNADVIEMGIGKGFKGGRRNREGFRFRRRGTFELMTS